MCLLGLKVCDWLLRLMDRFFYSFTLLYWGMRGWEVLWIPYKLRVGNRSVIIFVIIFVFTALFAGFYELAEGVGTTPVLNGFKIDEIEF